MTIAENLQRIQTAKADIKTAIENKGVNVGDITIDGYAAKIDEIAVGGGESGLVKLPNGISLANSTFTEFDMNGWDWSYVYDFSDMFSQCGKLENLISVPIKPMTVKDMFYNCLKLNTLDTSNWDLSQLSSLADIFYNCRTLTTISGIESWDTSMVTDMMGLFYDCQKLPNIDLSGWDTSKVTNMQDMFYDCYGITSLDVSSWDTSNVTNMQGMFYGCTNLTAVDTSGWNASKVTTMKDMFYNCKKLIKVDLSGIDLSNVTNMANLFANNTLLSEIKLKGNISGSANITNAFLGIAREGTLYYDERYDYSRIISALPSGWTTIPTSFE